MQRLRYGLIVMSMLLSMAVSAEAQISIGIGLPNVSIGINVPLFPELVPVPGYPVYYAPRLDTNYFFYDGMYWVFQDDNWYASSWYNGPWSIVGPEVVPLYILRIPVRYYRQPPVYFRGWRSHEPPRWGQHWGRDWEQRRHGWDRWNRRSAPSRAPLPVYQRQYSGDRYPHVEQQHSLRSRQYRYQPRDRAVREHFRQPVEHRAPAPSQRGRQEDPSPRSQRPQDIQRSVPPQHGGPGDSRPQPQYQPPAQQRGPDRHEQRQPPAAAPREHQPQSQPPVQHRGPERQEQRQPPVVSPREQQPPRVREQEQRRPERVAPQESDRGRGQGPGRDDDRGRGQGPGRDDDRGRGRNN